MDQTTSVALEQITNTFIMGSACQANDQSISGEENPGRAGIDVRNPPTILGRYLWWDLWRLSYTATNTEHIKDTVNMGQVAKNYKRGATNEIRLKDSAIVAYNTDRHLAMPGSVALSGVPCHVDAGRYPFGPGVLCTCVCTRGRTTNEHKAARYRIVVDSSGIV